MIYFVGIHNKPGMAALDSRTYTGKIIDMIIAEVGEGVKTNFADLDYPPPCPYIHSMRWHEKHQVAPGDTIVLLGKYVQEHFAYTADAHYLCVDHPSAFRVRADVAGYVERVAASILENQNTI